MGKSFKKDKYLIKRLRKGDEKAYVFLMDSYHHRLCIYAYSLVRDKDQAADIVQNVFMRTWELRDRLKVKFSIKSFLYRSVYNEFIDQYRKRKSIFEIEKKYIEALDHLIEDSDPKQMEKLINVVKFEIENLSPRCKEVFVLSKKEGLTNIEISEYLNISVKTVEAQITKAFSQLREKLGDKMELLLMLIFGRKEFILNICRHSN